LKSKVNELNVFRTTTELELTGFSRTKLEVELKYFQN